MLYEILEKKLKNIPEDFLIDVAIFFELLEYKIKAQEKEKNKKSYFGVLKNEISFIAPDFDEPLDCFKEYM